MEAVVVFLVAAKPSNSSRGELSGFVLCLMEVLNLLLTTNKWSIKNASKVRSDLRFEIYDYICLFGLFWPSFEL